MQLQYWFCHFQKFVYWVILNYDVCMIVMNQQTDFGNVLVVDDQSTVKLQRQLLLSFYVDAKVNHWAVDRKPDRSIIANSITPEIIINFLIVRKLTFYNKNADFVWAKMSEGVSIHALLNTRQHSELARMLCVHLTLKLFETIKKTISHLFAKSVNNLKLLLQVIE